VDFTNVLLLVSMTQCWLSMRYWLWYEVVRCRGLSKGCFEKIPGVRMGLWAVGNVPLGMEWDSEWIGKVPEVWCGMERCFICEK
jgi:hypothetical protein